MQGPTRTERLSMTQHKNPKDMSLKEFVETQYPDTKLNPWQERAMELMLERCKGGQVIMSWPRSLGKSKTTKLLQEYINERNERHT